MIVERPDQWRIDRLHEERGLWALDVTTGTWTKVYDRPGEFRQRHDDFVFCSYVEAARIYAGGLVPVEALIVDKPAPIVDNYPHAQTA